MANSVKGKLTNKDGGSLDFAMNPTDFKLARSFEYQIEPCVGGPVSMISFRTGNVAQLSFSLLFDKDAEPECDLKKVTAFVKSLNKINEGTKSVPLVEFTLGSLTFRGYVATVGYQANRFDHQGEILSARVDFSLLSNGDYENGK